MVNFVLKYKNQIFYILNLIFLGDVLGEWGRQQAPPHSHSSFTAFGRYGAKFRDRQQKVWDSSDLQRLHLLAST